MRSANIYNFGVLAGKLEEIEKGKVYKFTYQDGYKGPPISQTMPVKQKEFTFNEFPPFFDGLLPEGVQLENLIRQSKIDRNDFFAQLITVGGDLVGSITTVDNENE